MAGYAGQSPWWNGNQQDPPRRRGLLSRAQAPQAPQFGAEAQGSGGWSMLTDTQPQAMQLAPQASPIKVSPWMRIGENIRENPNAWLTLGAGLLDAANNNGTIMDAAQGFGQQVQMQQENTLRREDQDYVRGQRQQEADDRTRAQGEYQRILNDPTVDPSVKAAVRAAGPSQMGSILGTQVMGAGDRAQIEIARERAKVQDSQWAAGYDLDKRRVGIAEREAATAQPSPYYAKPTGRDAMIFQQYEGAYASSQEAINNLKRTKQIIQSLAQAGAMGQPVDAAMRMRISRLTASNPEARTMYENLNSQVWPVVLKNLEGLAPVTQVELAQAMQRTINADMTPAAAIAEVDRLIQNAERAQATAGAGLDFTSQGGSYATGRNAQGQTWREVLDATQKPYAAVAALPAREAPTTQQRPRDLASLIDNVLNPQSQPGSRVTPQQLAKIPVQQRQAMMRNMNDPQARAAFDQQYGAGSAEALRRAAAGR